MQRWALWQELGDGRDTKEPKEGRTWAHFTELKGAHLLFDDTLPPPHTGTTTKGARRLLASSLLYHTIPSRTAFSKGREIAVSRLVLFWFYFVVFKKEIGFSLGHFKMWCLKT